jgi:hypothetical protein
MLRTINFLIETLLTEWNYALTTGPFPGRTRFTCDGGKIPEKRPVAARQDSSHTLQRPLALAISGGDGAFSSFEPTVLLTVEATTDALRKAEQVQHRPPGTPKGLRRDADLTETWLFLSVATSTNWPYA